MRIHGAAHYTTEARNERRSFTHSDDARRSTNYVDRITELDTRSDRVPMSIESADGDEDARRKTEFFSPFAADPSGQTFRGEIPAREFVSHASEQRIYGDKKLFGRESAETLVPHPFMSHCAYAARRLPNIVNTAKHSGNVVAVFECRYEPFVFNGIVPQPVEKLRESPFRGVHAATPLDRWQVLLMCLSSDFCGFARGSVVGPQVVLV